MKVSLSFHSGSLEGMDTGAVIVTTSAARLEPMSKDKRGSKMCFMMINMCLGVPGVCVSGFTTCVAALAGSYIYKAGHQLKQNHKRCRCYFCYRKTFSR